MLILIWSPFHLVLPQWHIKHPGHSAKSAGGRLHLNTNTPLTQQSKSGLTMPSSRHSVGTYQGNKITPNSSGNTQVQPSQLAEPLWTVPDLKIYKKERKIGVCEQFPLLKKSAGTE